MKKPSRVLLLMPTTTYRSHAFLEAACRLGLEVVVGSDEKQVLAEVAPGTTLVLSFQDLEGATQEILRFAKKHPLDAIVSVDDEASLLAALASCALSLPSNSVESVGLTRNKYEMRKVLTQAGIPQPWFRLLPGDGDPQTLARLQEGTFPCVLKPLFLAASRGVIRANNEKEFRAAFHRLASILKDEEVRKRGGDLAQKMLVEGYLPGKEIALEGLLIRGSLKVLALFDKPDPLEGPFFEETLYVTPSRLPLSVQGEVSDLAEQATRALGLSLGPIHAEIRIHEGCYWVVEVAARSIGGLCSRALRFGSGVSLEELILSQALQGEGWRGIEKSEREKEASGVMMIPIPRAGILKEVRGFDTAKNVSRMVEVVISIPVGQLLVPLPEGSKYLGFIFSRAKTPEEVETALRKAHACLDFIIE